MLFYFIIITSNYGLRIMIYILYFTNFKNNPNISLHYELLFYFYLYTTIIKYIILF